MSTGMQQQCETLAATEADHAKAVSSLQVKIDQLLDELRSANERASSDREYHLAAIDYAKKEHDELLRQVHKQAAVERDAAISEIQAAHTKELSSCCAEHARVVAALTSTLAGVKATSSTTVESTEDSRAGTPTR